MALQRFGVIGAGTMGIGIAYVLAAAGGEVSLVEPDAARREMALGQIKSRAERSLAQGRLAPEKAARLVAGVVGADSIAGLPERLDLVIEAIPERVELKRAVLGEAESRAPRVLATNTSGIRIDQLAASLCQPDRFVGMHFFNPVWSMPLVEIVRGSATSEQALAVACGVADLIGKQTIVVNDSPGFATSRLGVALGLEAIRMVEQGVASVEDIDSAMHLGYGHPMGPLRLTDLVGLDIRLDIARNLAVSFGPRFDPPRLLVDKVSAGETGKKAGKGFYEWSVS
jgi:3-hydroxybutyryl-CoA dehydrogenase